MKAMFAVNRGDTTIRVRVIICHDVHKIIYILYILSLIRFISIRIRPTILNAI